VARLRGCSPGAFDEVYDRYRERIWRFLHRLGRSTHTAEDLFQDTWLAAARNAHRLREDTELLPWLYTIARNKHRNSLRLGDSDRRRRDAVRADPGAAATAPDDQVDARVRADRLGRALDRLPDAHREVLLLLFVEGFSSEEAARVLDIREDAVRKRLSRARAALMRLLDAPDEGGMP
jgi:RNA polymerase sigma factor (sigma-70 family)